MSEKIDKALASMEASLEAKTGKSLAAWAKIAQGLKLAKHGEIVARLKAEHGIGHGYANMIAARSLGTMSIDKADDDLLAAQYAGEKAGLRPIYDSLVKAVQKFGSDVEISPKKTYVSLRRKKQFALIQPTTKTRLDVGINLKGTKAEGRLEPSGSFNAMVSHRVRVESAKDADKELVAWLKQAYDAAG